MDTLRTGDRALIRELNTSIVLDCVRKQGPIARSEIASMTGMGRSTVSGIVAHLLENGLIVTVGAGDSTGGRRPEMLAFNPGRYYSMGIQVASGSTVGCLTDLDGRILFRASKAFANGGGRRREASSAVRSVFERLLEEAEVSRIEQLLGVGIVLPGVVDARNGIAVRSPDEGWRDWPVRRELEDLLEVPVWVDSDAQVGALGEKWAGRGEADDFLFVSVGDGIGAGLVIDGKLLGTDRTGVGQLGHMRLLAEGPACSCGLTGCLETLAGNSALIRYYKEGLGDALGRQRAGELHDLSIRYIAAAAHEGNPAAIKAIDKASGILGTAVANTVKLLGVNQVVVAGETAVLGGSLYLDGVSRRVKAEVPQALADGLVVRQSKLGNEVWLAGAAALVIEEVFRPPIYSDARPIAARVVSR